MPEKTVLLSMGTRPEIIKMAPVYHALRETGLQPRVLHTGQHTDLAWPLYKAFRMLPTYSLNLPRKRATLGHLSSLLMAAIDNVLEGCTVDAMLVHGDTSSALMATLAGYYHQVPVGHVEAGLRSFDLQAPFPEEGNRRLISNLAQWHYAPTPQAARQLIDEGVDPAEVRCVGNTIVDATHWCVEHLLSTTEATLTALGPLATWLADQKGRRLLVVTAHRRENWGRPLADIAGAVRALVEAHDDLCVVWPVHPNPIVKDAVAAALQGSPAADRICTTAPLAYPAMIELMRRAWLILTDSGGLQEEAATLRVPVLVLRDTTERGELIEAGGGLLVGTDPEAIQSAVVQLRSHRLRYQQMTAIDNPFGTGTAAEAIATHLDRVFRPVVPLRPSQPALAVPRVHLPHAA